MEGTDNKTTETELENKNPIVETTDTIDTTDQRNEKTVEQPEQENSSTNPVLEKLNQINFKEADRTVLTSALNQLEPIIESRNVDPILKSIKERFDILFLLEKELAQQVFEKENGTTEGFKYAMNDEDQIIFNQIGTLTKKRKKYFSNLHQQKDSNYKKKQDLLEKLRTLLNDESSIASIKQVKEIQENWKNIGPVPHQYSDSLWASFRALIDRFYTNRNIDFRSKELDREKNLSLKLALCEKVDALSEVSDIVIATKLLDDYHQEFKRIGPVPREKQEELWDKFKTASNHVYERRQAHYDVLKSQMTANYELKKKFLEQISSFTSFESDRINEWNSKTKELTAIQKEWEQIGSVPKEFSGKINKEFWGGLKTFFKHKNEFFKSLEKDKEENLLKKQKLVDLSAELKDNEDFQATVQKFKDLQAQWKEIGRAPEKYQNSIYKEFKANCDHFFNRRKRLNEEKEKEFIVNLKSKEAICDQIEKIADNENVETAEFIDLIEKYNAIGFVPRNDIKAIGKRFEKVTTKFLNSEGIDETQKQELAIKILVYSHKGSSDGEQSLDKIAYNIRMNIQDIEGNISSWENNLSFFSSSATADKLKEEFGAKIEASQKEIRALRKQLTLLKKLSTSEE